MMKDIIFKAKLSVVIFYLCLNPLYSQTATATPPASEALQMATAYHFDCWYPNDFPSGPLDKARKKLLIAAFQWMDQNLKCDQVDDNHNPSNAGDKDYQPILGRCTKLDKVIFGDFGLKNSVELVVCVNGGYYSGAHGMVYSDQKFIHFQFSDSGLTAQVFEQDQDGCEFDPLKFPQGPDLIRVKSPELQTPVDHPPAQARLYGMIGGKMKLVLTYDYADQQWQDPEYFDTRLILEQNRGIQLLKFHEYKNQDDSTGSVKMEHQVTESLYRWNPGKGVYDKAGVEKTVPEAVWEEKSQSNMNSVH